jgi:hypothetical protein
MAERLAVDEATADKERELRQRE